MKIDKGEESHHVGLPALGGNLLEGRRRGCLGEENAHQVPHLFILKRSLQHRLGFNRFALFVYILYSVRFVSLIRKNDTGVKIAPRLSHRLVGVPPLKLYRTNPLILFCGQTRQAEGMGLVT